MLSAPPPLARKSLFRRWIPERKFTAMTLCIAAIAREKGIIAVSDMPYNLGYTSGDGMPKMSSLNRWLRNLAGQDVGNAPALLANISEAMEGVDDASRKHVQKLFQDEYRAALEERIESPGSQSISINGRRVHPHRDEAIHGGHVRQAMP